MTDWGPGTLFMTLSLCIELHEGRGARGEGFGARVGDLGLGFQGWGPETLPSIRRLAQDLQISVITTKRAYDELEAEGFIDTVAGKGTFVAAQNADFLREKRMKAVEEQLAAAVADARLMGMTSAQLAEMLRLLWEEGA
ncbi:MAG TPA: GntR family transcriptional regulator [Vicinamibacterales bacterium]|nr:GntR family transcriptional regulator [Vicinamibacterales bacterium]